MAVFPERLRLDIGFVVVIRLTWLPSSLTNKRYVAAYGVSLRLDKWRRLLPVAAQVGVPRKASAFAFLPRKQLQKIELIELFLSSSRLQVLFQRNTALLSRSIEWGQQNEKKKGSETSGNAARPSP